MPQSVAETPPIDTKSAHRRSLRFASLDEVVADLDAIEDSLDAGALKPSGNWSVGEACDHLRKFFEFAIDGFPSKAPAPVRLIARMMLKRRATASDEPFPAGFKLPKAASALLPTPVIGDRESMAALRVQSDRVQKGERFSHPSPLIGSLTHDEWMVMQLKHFSLHLSFLHPSAQPTT
ncbi:MAG: DUF1569 domain-containing protein [Phycisphaerales bacterium]